VLGQLVGDESVAELRRPGLNLTCGVDEVDIGPVPVGDRAGIYNSPREFERPCREAIAIRFGLGGEAVAPVRAELSWICRRVGF
jgi:hypothetical protein